MYWSQINDSDSDLDYATPGFKSESSSRRPKMSRKNQKFESWDEEEFCPGEPRLPLGSFSYNKVSIIVYYFSSHPLPRDDVKVVFDTQI